MSVRVDQRKESQCEFLNTAHELEKLTIQLSMRENAIPKRYRFTLGLPLCESARALNMNIIYANSIFPTTKEEYQLRRMYQLKAKAEVKNLYELMRLATELLPIKNTVSEEWVRMAHTEDVVLRKWIQSDKQRYKDLL
jgi:hypothetical protein